MGKKRKAGGGGNAQRRRHEGGSDAPANAPAGVTVDGILTLLRALVAWVCGLLGIVYESGEGSAAAPSPVSEREDVPSGDDTTLSPAATSDSAASPPRRRPGACGVKYKKIRSKHCDGVCHVIRHGERFDHVTKGWRGNPDDPPLSNVGLRQARDCAAHFAEMPAADRPVAVFASPFHRTLQTANEIATRLRVPLLVEPGLSEFLNKKQFTAQPRLPAPTQELWRTYDQCYTPVRHTLPCYPEKEADCKARFLDVLTSIVDANPSAHIVVVTHRFGIESLIEDCLSSRRAGTVRNVPYCSITSLERRVTGDRREWSYRGNIADTTSLTEIRGIYFKR